MEAVGYGLKTRFYIHQMLEHLCGHDLVFLHLFQFSKIDQNPSSDPH